MATGQYDYYFNHRFGFSVEIPSGLTAEPPPINGDGQVYRATDGSFRLAVSAIDGATSDTLATFMAADMAACLSHPPEYTAHRAAWNVFSCQTQDGILYEKAIKTRHGEDAIFTTLRITYLVTERARWDGIIAHVGTSLRGALHDESAAEPCQGDEADCN